MKPYPEYKDSGLPWLGRVPSHWKLRRAKYLYREVDERSQTGEEELCSVSHKTGVTPRKENVTMFMAESTVGYKIVRPNDLAINTLWAWMAALGIARQVGVVSPAYGVYRPLPDSELVPDFADRLLRIEEYKAEYMARSTGINASRLRLYPDQFLRIPLLVPTHDEQVAIAHYLDGMDQKVRRFIRNRRRLIEVLNEQKQAIINRAVTRGLDFDVPLKSSGIDWLGDIPEHWEVKRLKMLVRQIDQGVSPQAENMLAEDGMWGVLKAGCVNRGVFRPEQHKRLPDGYEFDASLAVSPGDALVSRACGSPDLVGSVGRVTPSPYRLILSDKTFRPVFRSPSHTGFFVYAMTSAVFRRQVRLAISGAEGLANNLPLSSLRDFLLPYPPLEEAQAIEQALRTEFHDIEQAIAVATRETDLIREYRTRLIADVVTGRVDVRGLAPAEPLPADEQINEGIDDEEMLEDDDTELVQEAEA